MFRREFAESRVRGSVRLARRPALPAIALVLLGALSCACASTTGPGGAPSAPEAKDPEASRFGFGQWYAGLSAGYAVGIEHTESNQDVDDVRYVATMANLGVGITDPMGGDAWYRGNVDLIGQGFGLIETEPRSGWAAGGGLLLRYNWLRNERFVPFVNIGAGLLHLDFDLRSQRDGFAFLLEAGAGSHFFVAPRWSLTAEYRFQHISNARTRMPNHGTNANAFLLGTTFFFD